MSVQLSFEKKPKGVSLSFELDTITVPKTEAPVSPAQSTAVSISPLRRLPSVGGGETGFRSIVLGPEAETLAPKPLLERGVEFVKRAVSRKPSEFREGANELIDQAFGVPEGENLTAGEFIPQFFRTGGRLATFGATLGPEIVERAVDASEAPPTQDNLLGFDLGKARNFLQQEVQGIVDVVMKSIETSRSVAGIGLQAAGLETQTAADRARLQGLLERPEETFLGLSIAAAPITGALKPRPTGLAKTVAEAPKPVVKRIRPQVEERPPLGTTRVKVAEPGRPTAQKVAPITEATRQKRLSEISEQALKQREAQKEAGVTAADIKPKERIPTQLTPEPKRPLEKGIQVLTKKKVAEDLKSLGLKDFPKRQKESLIQSTEKAITNKEDVNALAIVTEKLKTKQPLSASEQVGIALTVKKILPEYRRAAADFRRLRSEGKDGAAQLAQDRANALLGELRKLEEGAQVLGGETAKSLGIRGRIIDENIATVLLDAEKIKGSKLSRPQTEKLEEAVTAKEAVEQRVDDMLSRLESDLVKNQQLTAEQFIKSENRKFSQRRTEARKEKVRAKRADLKKQILELGLSRLNDITGVTAEGAFLIGQVALTYMEEAGLNLSQIVKKVREDYPQLSSSEVIEALNTKNPRRQRKAQSEATKQVRELKTQARLLDDIRKAGEGVFAPGKTRLAQSVEIKKLQKTLTELRNQAFKAVTEGAKLERALQTIDRLQDQLANQFRDIKNKRKTDPAELKSAKEKIQSLRSDMKVTDALADVQEQLRTGDFKVKEVREREVPIEIQRQQVKLKRARRQIRDIQEGLAPRTVKKVITEGLNFARTIKATADMSATFRQGLIPNIHLLRKGQFGRLTKIHGQSIKSFFSEFTADQIDIAIRNADQHFIREQSGLFLAERGAPKLNAREENFMSKYAERIPVLGQIIKASDRHMATSLNLLRTSMFDMFLEKFPNATRAELTAWADYVNKASGRGSLKGLENSNWLSGLFFAPRFAASRFQTPAMVFTKFSNKRVRNEIAKDIGATLAMGTATLYLADLAGADVNFLDPKESDWLRIRFGDTRVDPLAGFQPVFRLAFRSILSGTDRIPPTQIPASEFADPGELFMRFVRYKASPGVNIGLELITGKTVVGEPRTPTQTAINALLPIIVESTIEAYKKEGFGKAGLTFGTEFVGFGASTFEDSKSRVRRDIRKQIKDENLRAAVPSGVPKQKGVLIASKEVRERAANWNLLNKENKIKSITVIINGKEHKVRVAP